MKLAFGPLNRSLQRIILFALLSLSIFNISAQTVEPPVEEAVEETADAGGNEELIAAGKEIFEANCESCHTLGVDGSYPNLVGVTDRREKDWIKTWVTNPQKMYDGGDATAKELFAKYQSKSGVMSAFDYFTDEQHEQLYAYLQVAVPGSVEEVAVSTEGGTQAVSEGSADFTPVLSVILLVLVLIIVALVLMFSVLMKHLKEKDSKGELSEEDTEFVQQKHNLLTVIKHPAFIGIVLTILGACGAWYGLQEGIFGIGVQTGYQPVQPIPFSHKLHTADVADGGHEIDCQYCHTGVRKAKHANIPSGNICMNCHVKIKTDSEILQSTLYKAMDYNPESGEFGENQTPIKWVRVHNLPDHVYFNHSQHVKVGGIECETCHGPIKEMEGTVYQYSTLTMGWCIDCHRNTNLNTEGNAYYDDLVKRHDETGEGDFTVEKNGGTECARCHY